MTATRATAILRLLKLSQAEMRRELNRLAGTNYGEGDVYKWLAIGQRGPSVTATLYLRWKILAAWRRRQDHGHQRAAQVAAPDFLARVTALIQAADPEILARFERRLELSEGDLSAKQRKSR